MEIKGLRPDLEKYLKRHGLAKKFAKQSQLFCQNPHHPSLNTERLRPAHLKIYSFRLDHKYRAIFIVLAEDLIEIIDINLHYR